MGNALEQLRKETRDDARLYGCIRELYEQGVPFEELKAVIPDIRRTREQLHMKRMLENNNEVLMQMFSREMSFLLDAKERQEEEQFKKIDQLIRQQQKFSMQIMMNCGYMKSDMRRRMFRSLRKNCFLLMVRRLFI